MEFVHLRDLTDEQWHEVHDLMFDPYLASHMGISADKLSGKPDLVTFYRNLMGAHKSDKFELWAISGTHVPFLGHVILDKSTWGEWELSVVLRDPKDWGAGKGVKAALHALKWAFEKDASEWVIAFVQNRDGKVEPMLRRMGFRPLSNAFVMDNATWKERWQGRVR